MSSKRGRQPVTEFTLVVQDCLAGMQSLPAQSVDVVVTSPPYNIGVQYNSYNDCRSREDYLRWTMYWANEVKRVLKPGGSFFLNLGAIPKNPLVPHELIMELSNLFVLQNTFHWIKSVSVRQPDGGIISTGHFKPINSRRFVNDCHEFVFHLTKHGTTPLDRLSLGVPYADKSNVTRWTHTQGRDVRCGGNVWFIPYETISRRQLQRPHPATFPMQLAVNCIKIHGNAGESVVLDPFMGLGHTALAAKRCGVRRFIGFDIDPEYVELAREKLG